MRYLNKKWTMKHWTKVVMLNSGNLREELKQIPNDSRFHISNSFKWVSEKSPTRDVYFENPKVAFQVKMMKGF